MTVSKNDGPAPPRQPELLAPAGDIQCARAAVENGADAVYFGLRSGLNARARAVNFAPEELPELMAFLHRRHVRGYLTLNTLVFCRELPQLEAVVRQAADAGVDAVLVQDFGAARLIRAICPGLELHASTQMSLTSAEGLRAAESLGIARVVLARELSLAEIRQIRSQTRLALEVFAHGALCIAVSGQCLASLAMGGRSANRGQCAQACRLPYQLICDGRDLDNDRPYWLSPHDLAAYDLLPELLAAGIDGLKIEGRLKSAEYVAAITAHYRRAIDAACAGRPAAFAPAEVNELEIAFSRGFSHGWLEGIDNRRLVTGAGSANRGIRLGRVVRVGRDRVAVELAAPVRRGDGIAFERATTDDSSQGGRVYEVFIGSRSVVEAVDSGTVELTFAHGAIDFAAIRPGQEIWKTDDPRLERRLRKTFAEGPPRRRRLLDLVVEAAVGRPLRIAAQAENVVCRIESQEPLAEAVKHPLTAEVLTEQFGRLGGTPYELRRLDARIDGRPMAPLSVLGQLRRELAQALETAALARPSRPTAAESPLPALRASLQATADPEGPPRLHVLCRSLEQIEQALGCGAESVVADFRDLEQCAAAVARSRARGVKILLATPRIQKPGEAAMLEGLLSRGADGLLARNLAAIALCTQRGVFCVADFSLHAANDLTAGHLLQQGAARVTAACDCRGEDLFDLAAAVPRSRLEVIAHHHPPLFHTQHCIFCAALSRGTDRTDCGQPCRRHDVRLRDRRGATHLLRADAACRNTLFHAEAEDLADCAPRLLRLGVRHFRIELLDGAPADEVGRLLDRWRERLA